MKAKNADGWLNTVSEYSLQRTLGHLYQLQATLDLVEKRIGTEPEKCKEYLNVAQTRLEVAILTIDKALENYDLRGQSN